MSAAPPPTLPDSWYTAHAPAHASVLRYPPGSPNQRRLGCDLALILLSGQALWVEEKVRTAHWPDVAVEVAIERPGGRRVPGWVWHTLAHVLVYSSPREVLVVDLPALRWELYRALCLDTGSDAVTLVSPDPRFGGRAYNVLLDRQRFPSLTCAGCGARRWTTLAACDHCKEVRTRNGSATNSWPTP